MRIAANKHGRALKSDTSRAVRLVVRPGAVHPLRMMAWKCDLAHARGMRQRTFAATVLAFMLGLAISLAWSLVGSYGF
jgi:nitrate reductase NapE component